MALVPSPLSQVCKGIRAYLDSEINASDRSKVTVVLSTPADTASAGAGDSDHRLNLFFHRFEPAGLFPDTLPGETGWLRTFCLITPFAAEEDSVGPGENDLRLIGEVSRIFHERPVFILNVDGANYHLQAVFLPLGLDQLNQLWSTQGDTIYRPSLLYEISLMPVVPVEPALSPPLAAGLGLQVQATLDRKTVSAASQGPQVTAMRPATGNEDWAPALAFVQNNGCALSLLFAVGSPELTTFTPQVWVAGQPGATVDLRWESWEASSGWQQVTPATSVVITDSGIDPEAAAGATTVSLALPFNDRPGQLLLAAERTHTRSSDGAVLRARSNPLLVTLYNG